MNYSMTTAELIEKIPELKVGDRILLSGNILTARDAAHKRVHEHFKANINLPFELRDKIIYYCGPCPPKPGRIIGSCGPTTSARMDILTPHFLSEGVKAVIGKGPRSQQVHEELKKFKSVYLVVTGGAGAFLAEKVKKCKLVGFEDLGPEAVYELEVKDFPVTVALDIHGGDIFKGTRK